jgi:hypothetical protein
MKTLQLKRFWSINHGTVGALYFEGRLICYTMELPWNENKTNLSCVPPGTYRCFYLERSGSGKYRKVWHVKAVPGRSGILIHSGNYAGVGEGLRSDSRGCILPAARIGVLSNQVAGIASRKALGVLRKIIGKNEFQLEISWY